MNSLSEKDSQELEAAIALLKSYGAREIFLFGSHSCQRRVHPCCMTAPVTILNSPSVSWTAKFCPLHLFLIWHPSANLTRFILWPAQHCSIATYTAIESIFALIHKRLDGRLPETGQWHRNLLDAMTESTTNRRAVISIGCRDALEDYLAFRHRFRHGYGWQLDSHKVAIKLVQLKPVLDLTKQELRNFLNTLE